MTKSHLLLLDERSMGLAPAIVRARLQRIAEIDLAGTTVLLVEQNAALRLAHRGYVLENGQIALEGTGAELTRHEGVGLGYLGTRVSPNAAGPSALRRCRAHTAPPEVRAGSAENLPYTVCRERSRNADGGRHAWHRTHPCSAGGSAPAPAPPCTGRNCGATSSRRCSRRPRS